MPMCSRRKDCRLAPSSSWTLVPLTCTVPAVVSMSLLTVRMAVDLPEPDRPITTKISPSFTENETSSRPTTWPVWACTSSFLTPEQARS